LVLYPSVFKYRVINGSSRIRDIISPHLSSGIPVSPECIPQKVDKVWVQTSAPISGWYDRIPSSRDFVKMFKEEEEDYSVTITLRQVWNTENSYS